MRGVGRLTPARLRCRSAAPVSSAAHAVVRFQSGDYPIAMYDWITNREIAALSWISAILSCALFWTKTRPFLKTIATGLITPPLVTIILYTGVACFGGMLIFEPEDGWETRLKWISIIWFFTVGLRLAFKVIELDEAKWLAVIRHLAGVFTATAVFEFVLNFRSFSLIVEIILVPLLFVALYISTIKIENVNHEVSAILGNVILIAIFLICMLASLVAVFSNPDAFRSTENIRAFYVPFMLSLCVSPVVIAVFVISIYERILGSAQFAIRDKQLLRYAKKTAIKRINLNVGALERWRRLIHNGNATTRQEVDESISLAIRSNTEAGSA